MKNIFKQFQKIDAMDEFAFDCLLEATSEKRKTISKSSKKQA